MNSPSSTTFSIDLSISELEWLAGAFGIAQLSLPYHRPTERDMGESLRRGHKSLCEREIIRRQNGGWQVQPFAALVLQWMTNAPKK
jgi:hypothetical protein